VRPARAESNTEEKAVRRRGPFVDKRALAWVLGAAIAIGGCVGAMQSLSDPGVYEVSQRERHDDADLERVADWLEESPEAEKNERGVAAAESPSDPHMAREQARTAGVLGVLGNQDGTHGAPVSPFGADGARGNDPMSALGALMGDQVGENFGYGGLAVSGTGRGGGGVGQGTIGFGGGPGAALPQNAVLANTFVGGGGVRARLDELLDRGMMVDGERVRLTAFTDRHSLAYAVPSEEAVALYAELERPRVVAEGDRVHLAISMVAQRGEMPRRPRMDVRLVLDTSGSMSGEKFAHALHAARRVASRLRPNDRLGIIAYDTEARVALAPSRVGDGARARRAIGHLAIGGGTNIEAGLRLAAANPPVRHRPSDVGLVILLSDGQATDGVTQPRALGSIARELYDDHGVLTTTIGLGTDFDESTMLTIAQEGSGSYHFVRRPADVAEVLTDELDERAQAVAQALRLRVELADGVRAVKVYGSRVLAGEERAAVRRTELATDARIADELGITEDRDDEEPGIRMHLPTFRRGDEHVVLFELEVPPGTDASALDIARVHLEYKDLVRERNGEAEIAVRAHRVAERRDAVASTEREVKRTVLAFQAAEALQRAAVELDRGNLAKARELLRERREVLVAGATLWDDEQLARDAALLGRYERVLDGVWAGFGHGDRHTLLMAMNTFADRRMR